MSGFFEGIVTIALAIVGLALVAALVSRRSNTTGVIQAAGSAFGNSMGVALSPVTGASYGINLSYPGSFPGGASFGGLDFGSVFGT